MKLCAPWFHNNCESQEQCLANCSDSNNNNNNNNNNHDDIYSAIIYGASHMRELFPVIGNKRKTKPYYFL